MHSVRNTVIKEGKVKMICFAFMSQHWIKYDSSWENSALLWLRRKRPPCLLWREATRTQGQRAWRAFWNSTSWSFFMHYIIVFFFVVFHGEMLTSGFAVRTTAAAAWLLYLSDSALRGVVAPPLGNDGCGWKRKNYAWRFLAEESNIVSKLSTVVMPFSVSRDVNAFSFVSLHTAR